MVELHLVRHAPPYLNPAVAPWHWDLASSAGSAVEPLRSSGALPMSALWVCSPEPKALQTARLLADVPMRVDDRLREAHRAPDFLDTEEFHRRVLRSFEAPDLPAASDWEPLDQTRARVAQVAREVVTGAGDRNVVLVGHGTALTLLVAELVGEPPDVEAWEAMLLPDHCTLVLPDRGPATVSAGWGAWVT